MPRLLQFEGKRSFFDLGEAARAARTLKPTTAYIARILADVTDPRGYVEMTVHEMCRRSGYGRSTVLQSFREIVEAGLALRYVSPGGMPGVAFQWHLDHVQTTAEEVRRRDEKEGAYYPAEFGQDRTHEKWYSHDRDGLPHTSVLDFGAAAATRGQVAAPGEPLDRNQARVIWRKAYAVERAASTRYREIARLQSNVRFLTAEPRPENWDRLIAWSEDLARVYAVELELVAALALRRFFQLDDERLVSERHPLSFVPRELERIAVSVEGALRKMKHGSVPPVNDNAPPSSDVAVEARRAIARLGSGGAR